jgi:hypothetical protein
MKLIPLTQGKFSKVDDDDFDRLTRDHGWCAMYSKKGDSFYAGHSIRRPNGKTQTVRMHRIIVGATRKDQKVDHKNHDTLDNRRENLRICTTSKNMMNRKGPARGSKTCLRGVYKMEDTGKFRAMIRVRGKLKHLGLFITPGEAADAYWAANKKYFGKFGGKRPS